MSSDRLNILWITAIPPSPPRFGAQARLHGLMTQVGQHHDITAVVLIDSNFDIEECRNAMHEYCQEVVFVNNPHPHAGIAKRLLQVRSLMSARSFEQTWSLVPSFQHKIDRLMQAKRFDIVNLEGSHLGNYDIRQAPAGQKSPPVVVNSHEIVYELAQQFAKTGSLARRMYASTNCRKLKREELSIYRDADGVYLCSHDDEQRLLSHLPQARTTVVPNAADVDYFKRAPSHPKPDGKTIVYFGLLSTIPNVDAVTHFVADIWPGVVSEHPNAKLRIIGGRPPPQIETLAGPQIEVTGFLPDLRPHLAGADVIVVPLRLGGGTRLKIVEAMAMGNAIVSTSLGAEGIDAVPDRDILIADAPEAFAGAVNRLLSDPELIERIGQSARKLAVERYAWGTAARQLEDFYRRTIEETAV